MDNQIHFGFQAGVEVHVVLWQVVDLFVQRRVVLEDEVSNADSDEEGPDEDKEGFENVERQPGQLSKQVAQLDGLPKTNLKTRFSFLGIFIEDDF